jgi:hypothetical protein
VLLLVRFDCDLDMNTRLQAYSLSIFVLQLLVDPNLSIQMIRSFHCDLCLFSFGWIRRGMIFSTLPGRVMAGCSVRAVSFSCLPVIGMSLPEGEG